MTMTKTKNPAFLLGLLLGCASGMAADVPAILPRPGVDLPSDGKIKVYILAGQSNMVGFGYLQGSRPVYPNIYLSADPNIKIGRMPVGPSALLKHRVHQTGSEDAPEGAKVVIYSGAYKAGIDYSSMTPVKETTVPLGTVSEKLPTIDGPHTVEAKAFIDVPMSGTHEIHAGFEDSTHAIVSLEGKEVYRKALGCGGGDHASPSRTGKTLSHHHHIHERRICRTLAQAH